MQKIDSDSKRSCMAGAVLSDGQIFISPILQFPNCISLSIFKFLDTQSLIRCGKVCRKWFYLMQDPCLWTVLDFRYLDLNLKQLWKLLRCKVNGNTRELHIRGYSQSKSGYMVEMTEAFLLDLNQRSPKLCALSLEHLDLRHISVKRLPNGLKSLSLLSSMLGMDWFEELKHDIVLPFLESLDLRNCTKVSNNDLISLAYCKEVRILLLKNCYRISARGIPSITMNLGKLEVLDFSGCPGINDVGLSFIGKLKHLRKLSLQFCHLITAGGIRSLLFYGAVGSTLFELDIYSCHEVGNDGALVILTKASNLKWLNIGGCNVSEDIVQRLCLQLPKCIVQSTIMEGSSCSHVNCSSVTVDYGCQSHICSHAI